ncbi:MAG: YheT family hydrolase, partial [Leadbetterella sp.]
NIQDYKRTINSLEDFDNTYTAPIHGYKNALDFYTQASVKPLLNLINIPTWIVQAKNDPFLPVNCQEINSVCNNPVVKLILTAHGGHVGFLQSRKKLTFIEELALKIFQQNHNENKH